MARGRRSRLEAGWLPGSATSWSRPATQVIAAHTSGHRADLRVIGGICGAVGVADLLPWTVAWWAIDIARLRGGGTERQQGQDKPNREYDGCTRHTDPTSPQGFKNSLSVKSVQALEALPDMLRGGDLGIFVDSARLQTAR